MNPVVMNLSNQVPIPNNNTAKNLKKNNIYKVNFKAQEDDFVSQMFNDNQQQQPQRVQQYEYYPPQHKKQKKHVNVGAILAGTLSAVMLLYFGKELFGKKQKELNDLAKEIKNIARPDIKRQAEEEAARQSYERSNYRIKDLITLDKMSAKEETRELANIDQVKKYMDENIVGMDEAKDEIIKFLKEYNYNIQNEIINDKPIVLLLDGPPGTGKTTLSKVIADALGMYYKKVPLAGAEGSGSIVGFERTYSGSKGGAIADGFLEGKTKKVFYCFDEVDKASVGRHNGNPVDPLLSLCDNQGIFVDKYYNVPLDVSQCMFCFTSNELAKIPEALRSRVQLIKINPYDNNVKSKIAKSALSKNIEFNKLKDKITLNNNIFDAIATKTVDQGGRDTIKYVDAVIKKAKGKWVDGERTIILDKNFLNDIKIESALERKNF